VNVRPAPRRVAGRTSSSPQLGQQSLTVVGLVLARCIAPIYCARQSSRWIPARADGADRPPCRADYRGILRRGDTVPERRPPRRRDHPVITYLAPDDLKCLDAIAAKRDSSRSSVARELLRAALTASATRNQAAS
jgi:hypothetical protein